MYTGFWDRVFPLSQEKAIAWKKHAGSHWSSSERGLGWMAMMTGVPESTIRNWINRDTDVPSSFVVKIADVLGVSVGYLLTGSMGSAIERSDVARLVLLAQKLDAEAVEHVCNIVERMVSTKC